MKPYRQTAWALKWHSENKLDGVREYLAIGPPSEVKLFRTRRAARDYAQEKYGYIRERPDLKAEPHGWTFPQAIRVEISVTPLEVQG
jgi:hypothetical protein